MKNKDCGSAWALIALAFLLLAPRPAFAEKPDRYESQVEVYTEHGEVSGCGLSFVTVWTQDKTHSVGVSGSESRSRKLLSRKNRL